MLDANLEYKARELTESKPKMLGHGFRVQRAKKFFDEPR
jgi:hypothetical protein